VKRLVILIAVGVLPLGCAKTNFAANSADSSAAGLTASQSVSGMDGSTGVIVTGDNENTDRETGDENEQEDHADSADCANFFSGKVNASLSSPLVMQDTVSLDHVRGEVVVDAKNLTLEDIRGPVLAMLQTSTQIDNLRGPVCLQGLSLNNVLGTAQLTDSRGHVEIENLNMTSIEDTRGSLVIHGGSVQSIRNHRGHIRLIDATVGDMDDVRGEIDLEGTSSVTGTVTNSDPLVQK
jgi:hypothetical protein